MDKSNNSIYIDEIMRKLLSCALIMTTLFSICFMLKGTQTQNTQEVFSQKITNSSLINSIDNQNNEIILTIEVENSADDIQEIISLLSKHSIKVSFFVTGIWAEKHKDEIRLMIESGNDICCHGYTHLKMTSLDSGRVREEILSFRRLIYEVSGTEKWRGCNLFRPPFLEYDDKLLEIAGESGMVSIGESFSMLDWKDELKVDEVIENGFQSLKSGNIITFHNGRPKSIAVLEAFIDRAQKNNYSIKQLSEMLTKENMT